MGSGPSLLALFVVCAIQTEGCPVLCILCERVGGAHVNFFKAKRYWSVPPTLAKSARGGTTSSDEFGENKGRATRE